MSTRSDILTAMTTALETAQADIAYPVVVKTIMPYGQNWLTVGRDKVPLVAIQDSGTETIDVIDATHYRKSTNMLLIGMIIVSRSDSILSEIDTVQAWIERFIDSNQTLTSSVLDWQLIGRELREEYPNEETARAIVIVATRLIYVQTLGSP